MSYTYLYSSPIGQLTLASDGEHITGLWVKGQKYFAATLQPGSEMKSLPIFDRAAQWLDVYFSGIEPDFHLPLAPKGSPFRQAVWQALCTIPYGTVVTYADISRQVAERLGRATMSAQATGGAVGHNPITILIPCHRVVGTGGSLTGFASGIDAKLKLLTLET